MSSEDAEAATGGDGGGEGGGDPVAPAVDPVSEEGAGGGGGEGEVGDEGGGGEEGRVEKEGVDGGPAEGSADQPTQGGDGEEQPAAGDGGGEGEDVGSIAQEDQAGVVAVDVEAEQGASTSPDAGEVQVAPPPDGDSLNGQSAEAASDEGPGGEGGGGGGGGGGAAQDDAGFSGGVANPLEMQGGGRDSAADSVPPDMPRSDASPSPEVDGDAHFLAGALPVPSKRGSFVPPPPPPPQEATPLSDSFKNAGFHAPDERMMMMQGGGLENQISAEDALRASEVERRLNEVLARHRLLEEDRDSLEVQVQELRMKVDMEAQQRQAAEAAREAAEEELRYRSRVQGQKDGRTQKMIDSLQATVDELQSQLSEVQGQEQLVGELKERAEATERELRDKSQQFQQVKADLERRLQQQQMLVNKNRAYLETVGRRKLVTSTALQNAVGELRGKRRETEEMASGIEALMRRMDQFVQEETSRIKSLTDIKDSVGSIRIGGGSVATLEDLEVQLRAEVDGAQQDFGAQRRLEDELLMHLGQGGAMPMMGGGYGGGGGGILSMGGGGGGGGGGIGGGGIGEYYGGDGGGMGGMEFGGMGMGMGMGMGVGRNGGMLPGDHGMMQGDVLMMGGGGGGMYRGGGGGGYGGDGGGGYLPAMNRGHMDHGGYAMGVGGAGGDHLQAAARGGEGVRASAVGGGSVRGSHGQEGGMSRDVSPTKLPALENGREEKRGGGVGGAGAGVAAGGPRERRIKGQAAAGKAAPPAAAPETGAAGRRAARKRAEEAKASAPPVAGRRAGRV